MGVPKCPKCGKDMMRTHRTRLQRVLYSVAFECPRCHIGLGWHHAFLARQLVRWRFVFSRHSRCIRCAAYTVYQIDRRDHVDAVSREPLALVQRLLGAPIKKCPACRLQYYDWRPVRTVEKPRAA